MKIIVCVKQVPFIGNLKFDFDRGRIVRQGVINVLNAFDRPAVTAAVEIARERGGEVVVLTLGPPEAREALIECLALGADRGIHPTDPAFAGSDTLATARALAAAIRRDGGADLILAGKHSTDSETGQVGPAIAELLDLPQVTGVYRLTLAADGRTLTAEREINDGYEIVSVPLPAVVTCAERLRPPTTVTPEDRARAATKPIEVLSAADLGLPAERIGAAGSPTQVGAAYSVEVARAGRIVEDADPERAAQLLARELIDRGLFLTDAKADPLAKWPERAARSSGRAIWVVAEVVDGDLGPVAYELLGRAVELAASQDHDVCALAIGLGAGRFARDLAAAGADRIYLADGPNLAPFMPEAYADLLARCVKRYRPDVVLVPATAEGRDYAPRAAARLALGLTGDCIGLEWDDAGRLRQLRPAFGGNLVAPIYSRTRPILATVRPGALRRLPPDHSRVAPVEKLPGRLPAARTRVIDRTVERSEGAPHLATAPVIVGIGAGVGPPENYPAIYDLAQVMRAAIGGSRKVTDQGWLPRRQQIGLTGRAIAPRFYLALGVRGVSHHAIGIRRAGTIVAINNNPNAPIWKLSDLGIVGDWAMVVPALTRALRERQ